MELIRGKWCKIEKGLGYVKYFKYLKTDAFKQCWYSCSIKKETIISNFNFSNYQDWLDISWEMEEVSLSEIQQYLPVGHPDKEFILPEKWCVRDCEEVSKWASRVFGWGCYANSSKYLCVKVEKFPNFDSYCFYSKESARNYTEITFEEFKKYVLKQGDMKEKPIYVKVVDFGKEYSTHSDAREYGMTNYFYWTHGSPSLNPTTKYRVVKNVIVNNFDESYILLDESTGYEYLIQTKGCKIIENMKEREIIGYKLKEDCKQYEEAAPKIMNANWGEPKYHVTSSRCIKDLRKAGVLELWFEPIYKEEFKVGDWIYAPKCHRDCRRDIYIPIFQVKEITESYDYSINCWLRPEAGSATGIASNECRLATPEEIKKTLVEEAIKRGFKEGVKVISLIHNKVLFCNNTISGFEYIPNYDKLHFGIDGVNCVVIYEKGKWAEILPSYPQIEINGYKGEFFDWGVKFGCQKYEKEFVIKLAECIKQNGFKMDYKANIIQIAEYYLNKK